MTKSSYPAGVDQALAGLHEAISTPHRIPQVKARLASVFPRILNREHRTYLESKIGEIEEARMSKQALQTITKEIDAWNDREFPVSRGYRHSG